jgi:3-hydroxyisobutyrate dehydrogenase-like beta-hydroxyacid dehydrogenase
MRIGFVGLGQMGSAMAANLLKAGHQVAVWNRSPGRDRALVAAGATRAATPAEAAAGEVVLTMLADDRALEAVAFGPDGLVGAPALHLSHSTISPVLADRLADAQAGGFVSAPVFGRPPAAEAAKLFVVAAGQAERIDRCEALLSAIGQRTFRVGERPALANIVKLSGNFMIMAAVEAMAEAMTLAEANGVERAALLEVLTSTLFDAPVYRNYGAMLVDDAFTPAGFAAPLGLKDMTLVDAAAVAARVPMPTLGVVRQHLLDTIANEGEAVDWAAIALAVRRGAGRR